jgi:ribosomal protein S18 acetylase RimI-like enzyme
VAVEQPTDGVEFRESEVEDWPAIAALLGRSPGDGRRLRQQVLQTYDPWFSYVAELSPGAAAQGKEIAGASGTPIVGAVVAGVPRRRSEDPERAGDGRILWLGVGETHRRRRLGRRLLDLALDEFRSRRVPRVTLLVDGTQVEALALFRQAEFVAESQSLELLLPPARTAALAAGGAGAAYRDRIRPLELDAVPLLAGLLIGLAVERAEAPHDDLEALSPAQVEDWLQRPSTLAYAAWDAVDPKTPLGIAWASLRSEDAVLRFVGIHEDARRRGLGRALLAAIAVGLANAGVGRAGSAPRHRPLRATVHQPGSEREFFRALGFEAERVTHTMSRTLS